MTGVVGGLGQAAAQIARAGFAVFPCAPGGKRPASVHGLNDATCEVARVEAWWSRWPEANIGLRTGTDTGGLGVDVLDIDVHGGVDGRVCLRRLQAAGLVPRPLTRVRTGSGGEHWYYPARYGQRSWSEPKHGIDMRAGGGYVIAPPSAVRQDGGSLGVYVILAAWAGRAEMLDGAAIRAELRPPDFRVPFRIPATGQVSPDRLADWMAAREQGERNCSLFWAANRLAEMGATPEQVLSLRDAALRTGLALAEVDTTIRSAYRAHAAHAPAAPAIGEECGMAAGRSVAR